MSYRQIKAPALAEDAVTYDALRPGVISNQAISPTISELVSGIDTDTLLLHVASTSTLSKLTIADLSSTLIEDRRAESIITQSTEFMRTLKDKRHLIRTQTKLVGAIFADTDTIYDSTAIDAAVALNTAKISNVAHPLVETAVPVGALFTDTIYDSTAIDIAVDLNTAKVSNVDHPLVETAVPFGALFTDTIYDPTTINAAVALNTAKVTNVDHPLVETAVPVGAVFTDTNINTTLSINANTLTYTSEDGTVSNLDLSLYLDDTNLAKLVSGTLDSGTGIATFNRDDASTFTLDLSSLLDTDTTYSVGDGGLTEINFTTADHDKLDNIEENATADQTKADIDALGIAATSVTGSQATAISDNTAKVSNVNHPLVETAVPVGALFTDTIYDSTAIDDAVSLNTAKVSNVDHPLVETAVPVGAVFTDTNINTTLSINANTLTYTSEDGTVSSLDLSLYLDDTNLARLTSGTLDGPSGIATFTRDDASTFTLDLSSLLDTDTTYSVGDGGLTEINFTTADNLKLDNIEENATADQTKADIDALGIAATSVTGSQATAISDNTAKISNVDHPLVETAVPVGALFTDTLPTKAEIEALGITASSITGDLPAISGANLFNVNTADFVASGTLPSGSTVILKDDGTAEVIKIETTTTVTPITTESVAAGIEYTHGTTYGVESAIAFDPNTPGMFVVTHHDSSDTQDGVAQVGTISGTEITFGAKAYYSYGMRNPVIKFDPHNAGRFLIIYRGSSNYGHAIAGTITGTTITFGTDIIFYGNASTTMDFDFDPINVDKFVLVHQTNVGHIYAKVGTLTGTSIGFGSSVQVTGTNTYETRVMFDPNNADTVIIFHTITGSVVGTAVIGTISGTTITLGTGVLITSNGMIFNSVSMDVNTGKFAVSYNDYVTGNNSVVIGYNSGGVLTFGTPVDILPVHIATVVAFDPSSPNHFVVNYEDPTNLDYGTTVTGVVSDSTTITLGTPVVFHSARTEEIAVAFDPNTTATYVSAYRDYGEASKGKSIVNVMGTDSYVTEVVTNLTKDNFLGTSTTAYTDGDIASILLQGGISTNQSGLTIGETYYVQEDGTLATTSDTIGVFAGKALSTTSLQIAPMVNSSGVDFIAAGVILNGAPVILNTDGTVEALEITGVAEAIPAGTNYNSAAKAYVLKDHTIAYDENNADKFLMAFNTDGGACEIVVGTISGTTISYGTPEVFDINYSYYDVQIISLPGVPDKFIITYPFATGTLSYSRIVTVTGTSISLSDPIQIHTGSMYFARMVADPYTVGQFFMFRSENDNANATGCAQTGRLVSDNSGEVIEWGPKTDFDVDINISAGTYFSDIQIVPNTPGKFIIAYNDLFDGLTRVIVGTVVGTDITFGTPSTVGTGDSQLALSHPSVSFNPNNDDEFIIAYQDAAIGNYNGIVKLGTISGYDVTFGTAVSFSSGQAGPNFGKVAFDPAGTDKFVVVHKVWGLSTNIELVVGTLTGSVITFTLGQYAHPPVFGLWEYTYPTLSFDPHYPGKFIVSYVSVDTYSIETFIGQLDATLYNLTSDNFVGMSTDVYINGDIASIMLQGGVSTDQTGLTPGLTYYVQKDGTLEITPDTISVLAGKALSSTSLLIAAFAGPTSAGGSSGGSILEDVGNTEYTYESGGVTYKSHTFTSSGTFTLAVETTVEYLVIAGGGGGGTDIYPGFRGAGGGGAGGYRTNMGASGGGNGAEATLTLSPQTYTVVVGAGGSGGLTDVGIQGNSSSFASITSAGGGFGGGHNTTGQAYGGDGGSGGGQPNGSGGGITSGTNGQGYDGGAGVDGVPYRGSGGGGAGGSGGSPGANSAGDGGIGLSSTIDGFTVSRAGGGGGIGASVTHGSATSGGGSDGSDGLANYGSGGGAKSQSNGGNGGSGVVIIRYVV